MDAVQTTTCYVFMPNKLRLRHLLLYSKYSCITVKIKFTVQQQKSSNYLALGNKLLNNCSKHYNVICDLSHFLTVKVTPDRTISLIGFKIKRERTSSGECQRRRKKVSPRCRTIRRGQ